MHYTGHDTQVRMMDSLTIIIYAIKARNERYIHILLLVNDLADMAHASPSTRYSPSKVRLGKEDRGPEKMCGGRMCNKHIFV